MGGLARQGTYRTVRPFDLHRPASVAEACAMAAEFAGSCVYMGGGVDLLQRLKSGEPVENVIYLKSVAELKAVEVADGVPRIGACATHHDLETDPVIARRLPALIAMNAVVIFARNAGAERDAGAL